MERKDCSKKSFAIQITIKKMENFWKKAKKILLIIIKKLKNHFQQELKEKNLFNLCNERKLKKLIVKNLHK